MSEPTRWAAWLLAALATVGLGARCLAWGGAGLCLITGLFAARTQDTVAAGAGAGLAAASFVAAASPFALGVLRLWAAERRAERERRTRDHDAAGKIHALHLELTLVKQLAAEKEERIEDLERELAENRERLNEMAPRVRPPVEPLPPGPVERRVAESGQYPAVPE